MTNRTLDRIVNIGFAVISGILGYFLITSISDGPGWAGSGIAIVVYWTSLTKFQLDDLRRDLQI